MKIIILTRNNDYKRYFINHINSNFGIDSLFFVPKGKIRVKSIINDIHKHWKRGGKSLRGTLNHYISIKKQTEGLKTLYPDESKKKNIKKRILKDNYKELDYNGPIYKHYDVNSFYFYKKISIIKPDIILVFGTPLVANSIINMAKIASINVHFGLSPYYRGSNTWIWPIYNDEPEYIGVTIHHLSSKIDGGAIITQERPTLDKNETLFSIELKLAKLGTELMIKTIKHIQQYKEISGVKQDLSKGKLYLSNELNEDILNNIRKKLENNYFQNILPIDKKKYDMVKLIQNV